MVHHDENNLLGDPEPIKSTVRPIRGDNTELKTQQFLIQGSPLPLKTRCSSAPELWLLRECSLLVPVTVGYTWFRYSVHLFVMTSYVSKILEGHSGQKEGFSWTFIIHLRT